MIEERLKHFSKYKLLIIDEMGYIDLPKGVSNLLFRLVEKFYEKKSLIITTNKDYDEWLELFDNPSTDGAVIDRLLHHSKTFVINGRSYRAFEKIKTSYNNKSGDFPLAEIGEITLARTIKILNTMILKMEKYRDRYVQK